MATPNVMHSKVESRLAGCRSRVWLPDEGVSGGDGSVLVGDAADVLGVARVLPATSTGRILQDEACAPSGDCNRRFAWNRPRPTLPAGTPDWDYRQVYEVWIGWSLR